MAEVPGRMDFEAEFAKELARLLQVSMGQLLELLGDPPTVANLPQSFWEEAGLELQSALQRNFQPIYLAAAEQILDAQPIGVDWGLVNEGAARWARENAQSLALDIVSHNRRNVGEAVAAFFEEQQTIGDLTNQLSTLFGPTRAELIASTEVTRAAVQGEIAFVDELRKEGLDFKKVWNTRRDERVCPICEPLDQRPESPEGGFVPRGQSGPGIPAPPAHPRCWCWLNHFFIGEKEPIGG